MRPSAADRAISGTIERERGEHEAGLTETTSVGPRHAFGGIPVYPKAPSIIQTKLKVNAPGDAYEREADRIADTVMRMPEPSVRRACACGGECPACKGRKEEGEGLQRKHTASYDAPQVAPSVVRDALRSPGRALDAPTHNFMAARFGRDFNGVRVHTGPVADEAARAINARAFTLGADIVFGSGQYAPGATEGRRLLAHELTHVVQQQGSTAPAAIQRADLASPRLAGNPLFEDVLDNRAVIELGDTGPEVRRIQQLLIDLGFSLPVNGANGSFTAETENAVKDFQRSVPLTDDGRVGFRTIAALDSRFPAFALPADRALPWTMPCVLGFLCPWNRHLVTSVLPTFNIITFDTREFPVQTWDGSTWVNSTFTSGGFRSGNNLGFKNTTCERFAFTIYHEGWHAQQPSGLTGVVDVEKDAYVNTEQWSIDLGISGQTFRNRVTGNVEDLRTTVGGRTEVDEAAAETLVRQKYGGVSSTPGERLLRRVGATDVRVRRPDGSEYTRAAQAGESVRGAVVMTNQNPINPADWVCP